MAAVKKTPAVKKAKDEAVYVLIDVENAYCSGIMTKSKALKEALDWDLGASVYLCKVENRLKTQSQKTIASIKDLYIN